MLHDHNTGMCPVWLATGDSIYTVLQFCSLYCMTCTQGSEYRYMKPYNLNFHIPILHALTILIPKITSITVGIFPVMYLTCFSGIFGIYPLFNFFPTWYIIENFLAECTFMQYSDVSVSYVTIFAHSLRRLQHHMESFVTAFYLQ